MTGTVESTCTPTPAASQSAKAAQRVPAVALDLAEEGAVRKQHPRPALACALQPDGSPARQLRREQVGVDVKACACARPHLLQVVWAGLPQYRSKTGGNCFTMSVRWNDSR